MVRMKGFDFDAARKGPHGIIAENERGVEFLVRGNESLIPKAKEVADNLIPIEKSAEDLLNSFLKGPNSFEVNSIELFPQRGPESGDFTVRCCRREDPASESTCFEVFFYMKEPVVPHPPKYQSIIRLALQFDSTKLRTTACTEPGDYAVV